MAKDKSQAFKEAGVPEDVFDPFEKVAKQVQAEYNLAWLHQKMKKDEWNVRLKLYNNQRRDKKAVGDTTLFTTLQTVLASLYVDRLDSEWGGREEGDEEVAENLNALSRYDYDEMEKDVFDYDFDWDTCFFGRGLLEFQEFERDPDFETYWLVLSCVIQNLGDEVLTTFVPVIQQMVETVNAFGAAISAAGIGFDE